MNQAKTKLGDHRGAVVDCTEALKIDPNNVYALSVRGEAKSGLGDWNGAVADSTKALKIDPKNVGALLVRSQAIALRFRQRCAGGWVVFCNTVVCFFDSLFL